MNEDVVEQLSPMEQELCKSLTHIKGRGKKGRGVPMLLTRKMVEVLDLLVASREAVRISADNPYIFIGETGADAPPLRGSDCVRAFAQQTNAENITVTGYRRHVGTMLQLLQLSETEMDVVTRFMSHEIRVHREVYSLPERTVYAAKVSKVLFDMNENMAGHMSKILDELEPELEETDDAMSKDEEANHPTGREAPTTSSAVSAASSQTVTRKSPKSPVQCQKTKG